MFSLLVDKKKTMVKINESLALKIVVTLSAFVPIFVGFKGMFLGPSGITLKPNLVFKSENYSIEVDSHFRYISGYLFAMGIFLLRSIPNIHRDATELHRACIIVFIGGLGRLWGLFAVGLETGAVLATIVELVFFPMICYWQKQIQNRTRSRIE
ncbi:unnamed protein product [Adineta ricciae]|uniref:DUF4345 domain-containing protein n=1 Tax=Adineta ricciae TaxID=249248 RepID=A0A814QLC9_ADIRI|nr:unnamed protein product [Adineta ricciae]CAF1339085.1 unnamed protein product [Adineta ricciae]